MGDLFQWYCVFTIDGARHLIAGHAASAQHAMKAAKLMVQRRNIDIPTEKAELVAVRFKVEQAEIDKLAREIRNKEPETALSEEMSPADKALLMHKPISELSET